VRIAVMCDAFPELSQTFVAGEIRALRRRGHDVTVLALGPPARAHRPPGLDDLEVAYLDGLRRPAKLAGLAATALRHPRRLGRDVRDRPSWRPAEAPGHPGAVAAAARRLARRGVERIHVHFAAGAALEGLRIGRLLGVPVSITAHAYEIFSAPRNLERKLREAAFVTSGCTYTVRHLRALAGPRHAARVHEIVMGVDARTFTRARPHPDAGRVLAVGRLVEKKGFADLVEACGPLRDAGVLERLTIVGEGPLEPALRARIAALGLGDRVELAGPRPPGAVRALLEEAAVLAMPCVVAADGDRDSLPVAVKEALAMEVPVVATDEVGLPELVDAGCGRLVAPRDPPALAAALAELLRLAPGERAGLGREGRRRVLERCDVDRETGRLLALMGAG